MIINNFLIKVIELLKCNEPNCSYTTNKQKLLSLHTKRAHVQQSTPTETYSCVVCGNQYQTKCGLKNHIDLTHPATTNGCETKYHLNFICDISGCEAKFSFKSDLERHKLKHQDSKLFSCDACNFSTKRKSDLTRHKKLKHDKNQEIFKCNACLYETKNSCHMRRHKERKHAAPSYELTHVDPSDILIVKINQEVDICIEKAL